MPNGLILARKQSWGGLLLIAAAALPLPVKAASAGPVATAYDRIGAASWYGTAYHGRSTASGETFDMNGLTAAHRRLAFGSWVRVTNMANNRSLVVRINDRGPYRKGRIIDLSRRAADLLGFEQDGLARVRVRTVAPHPRYARDRHPIRLRPPAGL